MTLVSLLRREQAGSLAWRMVEKLFGDRRITATTEALPHQGARLPLRPALYVVSMDGQFLYEFDPALEPPQSEEEAVDFVIEVMADVRRETVDKPKAS